MTEKEMYMKRAIELAKTAIGRTSPNPMVGCVVVKDGKVISEACHERYGEFHAERNALTRCKEDTKGAELYVTLEPCCHYGKTPPCTEIIIEKGISKVYIGSLDSNPLVAGQGVEILKNAGIQVETGILEEECINMNEVFFHFIKEKKPFVVMKYAMTLDGKISAITGDSKWITNEYSRNHAHYLRKIYSGIMVGINTVLLDDPMLNCRIEEGVNPVRIILDSKLRIPMDSNIVKTAKEIRTIVAYNSNKVGNNLQRVDELKDKGIELINIPGDDRIDMNILMEKLGELKIDSILVEGGAEVNSAVLKAGVVNKVYAYIAPKLITGALAKSPIGGDGIELMKDAINLCNVSVKTLEGGDILVEGYVNKCLQD